MLGVWDTKDQMDMTTRIAKSIRSASICHYVLKLWTEGFRFLCQDACVGMPAYKIIVTPLFVPRRVQRIMTTVAAELLLYPILVHHLLLQLFIARKTFLRRSSLARSARSGYVSTLESGGVQKFSLIQETRELLDIGVRGRVGTRWLVRNVPAMK